MHQITVYTAGTDTRNQFTTPPDARQVSDLVTIHNSTIHGGGGTIAGSFNHTSTGNWVRCDWGSSDKVTDDGNWNGTYDCWAPPSTYFDAATTIYVDIMWAVAFNGTPNAAYEAGVQAATRASLGAGSVAAEYNGLYLYVGHYGSYEYAHTDSGTIPAVPLTEGQTVELRTFQNSGGNKTIGFRWGVRHHHSV